MTRRRTRRRRRRRRVMPPRRSSRQRRHRRRRRRGRRQDAAAPPSSFCRILPSTSTFRSPLISGCWPAARYAQSSCPGSCHGLPNPDIMYGSRLALLVIATSRHAARQHSHRPSSASHVSPWNQRPQPSQRYVIYASTVNGSQHLSLYVCMQPRRRTRASTELPPAGRAKRVAQLVLRR